MAAALALDERRVAHQPGEALAVERRRHRDEAEIGPQGRLRIEREGKAEIAVEAALVDLVEQNRRNAGQLRIGLDAVPEDAFGQHQDTRARRTLRVQPRRIADRLADPLPGKLRHPLGRRPRGEPPRGEQQDLAGAPGFAEESGGDGGGLARPRRGDEDGITGRAEGGEDVTQDVLDRQAHRHRYAPARRS